MTITRERARDVLATHLIEPTELACRRCKRTYRAIVEGAIECDVEPVAGESAGGEGRKVKSGRPWGSERGYVDPKRPDLAWIRAVCEPELRTALIARAVKEELTLSEIVRRACRVYVGLDET